MLRRVALGCRLVLLTAGLLSVVWLPVSWFYSVWAWDSSTGTYVAARNCWVGFAHIPSSMRSFFFTSNVSVNSDYGLERNEGQAEWSRMLCPQAEFDTDGVAGLTFVTVPLWLLAFLCLAWPVTSFLVARRRRGRGFAVEPLSTPLPPGEVPSPRGGEGGRVV